MSIDKNPNCPFIKRFSEDLKLYFRITCPRDWQVLKLARVQVEQKLPVVISTSEVSTLLKLIEKPSMHCFFTVVYMLGLRLNEALHLQTVDVDSKRMLVHIHRGKGAKDRLIPLPEMALQTLRQYWVRSHSWLSPVSSPAIDR